MQAANYANCANGTTRLSLFFLPDGKKRVSYTKTCFARSLARWLLKPRVLILFSGCVARVSFDTSIQRDVTRGYASRTDIVPAHSRQVRYRRGPHRRRCPVALGTNRVAFARTTRSTDPFVHSRVARSHSTGFKRDCAVFR